MLALLVATTGSQFLSLLPLHPLLHSHPHRAQKGPPPGCQGPTGQSAKCREQFKGPSTLSLLYKHTVMIRPNQPSPYTGEVVAQRRERDPRKTHSTSDPVPSPPSPQGNLILDQSAPLKTLLHSLCHPMPQTHLTD